MNARWRNALGVSLSAGLLVWTLWGQDPAVLWGHLRDSNWWWWAAACITGTLIFPLRAIRWRIILDPIAHRLPVNILWRATAIGMMGNNLLPARAGEFARAYALSRETDRVSFSAAFASLAVDRIFDAFVVLLLMLAAMSAPGFPDLPIFGRHVSDYVYVGALVAAAALGALYPVSYTHLTLPTILRV